MSLKRIIALAAFALTLLPITQTFAQGQGGGRHNQVCKSPSLKDDEQKACANEMRNATTREDRAKVRDTYNAKITAAGGTPVQGGRPGGSGGFQQ